MTVFTFGESSLMLDVLLCGFGLEGRNKATPGSVHLIMFHAFHAFHALKALI